MDTGTLAGWAADAVLLLHVAVVIFIVGTVPAILIGNLRHWYWPNALWLRLTHLAAMGFIVTQSWLQLTCPLTTLELWFRASGAAGNRPAVGCIEYWLGRLLYFSAPWWVFALAYSSFALLVLFTWIKYPPRSTARSQGIIK